MEKNYMEENNMEQNNVNQNNTEQNNTEQNGGNQDNANQNTTAHSGMEQENEKNRRNCYEKTGETDAVPGSGGLYGIGNDGVRLKEQHGYGGSGEQTGCDHRRQFCRNGGGEAGQNGGRSQPGYADRRAKCELLSGLSGKHQSKISGIQYHV